MILDYAALGLVIFVILFAFYAIIGIHDIEDADLDARVRAELRTWFGDHIDGWALLRIYRKRWFGTW